MQELTEIESTAAHTCAKPRTERWNVLEPVTGRWSWLTIHLCCNLLAEEVPPAPAELQLHTSDVAIKAKAA